MFTMPAVRVGPVTRHDALGVFPLFADAVPAAEYLLSDEAIAAGEAEVHELTEGGSVPKLAVANKSPKLLLFLEGEELRGAKQNRVLNTSVLVPAEKHTEIPVSCVEQGRWRYVSKSFASAGTHASRKLRKVLKESVTMSLLSSASHYSDQGEVWNEVGRQQSSLKATSASMAMSDTYDTYGDRVESAKSAVAYVEGAVGLAVAVGASVVALDLFDSPVTCQKVWGRVLSGVILDAIEDGPGAGDAAEAGQVEAALEAFGEGPWQAVKAAGAGEEYRSQPKGGWLGSALALNGSLIHGSLVLAT